MASFLKITCVFITALLSLNTLLFADDSKADSKAFALKGLKSYRAFECSVLASTIGDTLEQKRLFKIGYDEGKAFLKAIKENKISKKDLSSEVPMIMLFLLLGGPNDDFILGRIFNEATESALKGIRKTKGEINSKEIQNSLAFDKFYKCNCKLIQKALRK